MLNDLLLPSEDLARSDRLRPARIALIGGGPTTLYTLQALLEHPEPLDIQIFERDGHVGPGMPYRESQTGAQMLANIASRELPPLAESLVDWLASCDAEALADMGLTREDIDAEAFYPRLVLGRYFTAQLAELTARARAKGHSVTLRARHAVQDIRPGPHGSRLDWDSPYGSGRATFAHVILATGHQWDASEGPDGVTLHAPWPASSLRRFIGQPVAILGTSLTAIDAAVALAGFHGRFIESASGTRWEAEGLLNEFHLTLMSRKGLLPGADWYYDLPLPELPGLTEAATQEEIAKGSEGLLDRLHARFAEGLSSIDPAKAKALDVDTLDGLAERCFADRLASDPWEHARDDLATAEAERDAKQADPWRMALLRAHEILEEAIPHLTDKDRDRLNTHLKPIFTDCYASVPHRSIRRMIALHEAGVLELLRLGEDYRLEQDGAHVRIDSPSGPRTACAIIDARGQRPADLVSLFPGLGKGTAFDPVTFAVTLPNEAKGTIHCLAIPVLLPTDPFVQGLERVQHLGHLAASRIRDALQAPAEQARTQTS